MNIRHLHEFVVLAQTLNFTAAANQLYIAQPTLTKHIHMLEKELGLPLLERSTHGVALTSAGQVVLADGREILKLYAQMEKHLALISSGVSGEVKIGMLYYAIHEAVTPVAKALRTNYPNIKLSLLSYQSLSMIKDLWEDKIDIAVLFHLNYPNQDQLCFLDIRKEGLAAFLSVHHPLAAKAKLAPAELKGNTLVLIKDDPEAAEHVQNLLQKNKIAFKNTVYTDNIETLPLTIIETNGVAFVPSHIRNMKNPDIALVELDDPDFCITFSYIYKKSNRNPSIPIVLEQAKECYRLQQQI